MRIALAGNPNVGKSTVFNCLTGLNQRTGNWAGKTVETARGEYTLGGEKFVISDVPGTYSLSAESPEEEIARDFICFSDSDAVVIVADATNLQRNLSFIIQVLELRKKTVVCVNLMDEAEKKGIYVDLKALSARLGVPVVGTAARGGRGIEKLKREVAKACSLEQETKGIIPVYSQDIEQAIGVLEDAVCAVCGNKIKARWLSLKIIENDTSVLRAFHQRAGFDILADEDVRVCRDKAQEILRDAGLEGGKVGDLITATCMKFADRIFDECVRVKPGGGYCALDRKIDKVLTSPGTGIPIMLAGLAVVFWITAVGANYPSEILNRVFVRVGEMLDNLFVRFGMSELIRNPLMDGVYKTLTWVVSVMLPPMAIFFPLFTILEDLGYLPRVAFNLDSLFKRAGAHGKQALTMCMGFGCNSCGVSGCRIIDSPRERLIGILTNSLVPCNGRFPILISVIGMFFTIQIAEPLRSVASAVMMLGVIVLGVAMTFLVSRILSKTVLKGISSSFVLELPPYRRPQIGRVIVRSVFDRTLFVLARAVAVAAPAGLVIWLFANIDIGSISIIEHLTKALDPIGRIFGMDGVILLAFALALPANEIVFPIIIMAYMSTGSLAEVGSLVSLRALLLENGWTWITAVCTMLFTLFHFPCATTLWTIAKETHSFKWTLAAFLIPTLLGLILCFAVACVGRVFV